MDVADEMRLTDRQRYWLEQIEACAASGKSVSAYAADQGFHAHAMYGAKKVLVRKGALPGARHGRFQRVQTAAVTIDQKWRIQLPNGVSVDFSGTVDAGSLSTVLNTAAHLE
jgi:hypothetical protein